MLGYRFRITGWKPSGISRNLVSTLSFSDMLLKLLMQLVEVSDKVTCVCGSEVTFWMNCKVRMITLLAKKGVMPVVALGVLL